jgi:tRNA pseudouridine55 synthase
MDGLLLVDKPAGMTSHDVVEQVRRALKLEKAGHSGTLDPQATGLLVLALGNATRWLPYLATDKTYEATLKLGLRTDTQDVWGKPLPAAGVVSEVPEPRIRESLASLVGKRMQVPPMVSALKKNGRKLYDLARAGVEVERPGRHVQIFSLTVGRVAWPEADFTVRCSAGTYVRTLCDEVGESLGTGGCLSALRRTAVGPFSLAEALPFEEVPARAAMNLLGSDKALGHLPERRVDAAEEEALRHGRDLELGEEPRGEHYRLVTASGRLMALGKPFKSALGGWEVHPEKVFLEPVVAAA